MAAESIRSDAAPPHIHRVRASLTSARWITSRRGVGWSLRIGKRNALQQALNRTTNIGPRKTDRARSVFTGKLPISNLSKESNYQCIGLFGFAC